MALELYHQNEDGVVIYRTEDNTLQLDVQLAEETVSAVRIPRDPETLQSISTPHLYPCGEGAGYAGGITSSALDGINAALKIAE